jgi:hypothetical protein
VKTALQPASKRLDTKMRVDLQLVRCKTGLAIGKKPTSFITVCSTPQKGGTEQIRTQNWQKPTPIICPASPSQVRAPWQAGPSITRYKRYQPTTHKSASLLLTWTGARCSTSQKISTYTTSPQNQQERNSTQIHWQQSQQTIREWHPIGKTSTILLCPL